MKEPAQQLAALGIVMRMLHQRLADALGDAAMHLAVNDERIYGAADIVDRDVVDDADRTGFHIDLDLAHMGAIRETRLRDGLVAGRGQRPRKSSGRSLRSLAARATSNRPIV